MEVVWSVAGVNVWCVSDVIGVTYIVRVIILTVCGLLSVRLRIGCGRGITVSGEGMWASDGVLATQRWV